MVKKGFASAVKDLTPLAIGGAAIYLIVKSGILKNIGSATSGLGQGIGDIGMNLGNLTDPLGAFGSGFGSNIQGFFDTLQARQQQEAKQALERDIMAEPFLQQRSIENQMSINTLQNTFLNRPINFLNTLSVTSAAAGKKFQADVAKLNSQKQILQNKVRRFFTISSTDLLRRKQANAKLGNFFGSVFNSIRGR